MNEDYLGDGDVIKQSEEAHNVDVACAVCAVAEIGCEFWGDLSMDMSYHAYE